MGECKHEITHTIIVLYVKYDFQDEKDSQEELNLTDKDIRDDDRIDWQMFESDP